MKDHKYKIFQAMRFMGCMVFALIFTSILFGSSSDAEFFVSAFSIGAWIGSGYIPYFRK